MKKIKLVVFCVTAGITSGLATSELATLTGIHSMLITAPFGFVLGCLLRWCAGDRAGFQGSGQRGGRDVERWRFAYTSGC